MPPIRDRNESVSREPTDRFAPPAQKLGPHVASLGAAFYAHSAFPAQYRGHLFIAEHGSWNRSQPIGYRLTWVRVEEGKSAGYEVFAEGEAASARAAVERWAAKGGGDRDRLARYLDRRGFSMAVIVEILHEFAAEPQEGA